MGAAGLFALAAGIVLLAMYPITKQKYIQILAGIREHQKGNPVKDMFSKQIIPSKSKMSDHDRKNFWLLYSFAHWELQRAIRGDDKKRALP